MNQLPKRRLKKLAKLDATVERAMALIRRHNHTVTDLSNAVERLLFFRTRLVDRELDKAENALVEESTREIRDGDWAQR